jgi:hypothetical protein
MTVNRAAEYNSGFAIALIHTLAYVFVLGILPHVCEEQIHILPTMNTKLVTVFPISKIRTFSTLLLLTTRSNNVQRSRAL